MTVLNESEVEGAETIELRLSNRATAVLGTNSVASITILDDDSILQFTTNLYSISEAGGHGDSDG